VTVEFWHEWIVVQNGTVVLSDASPVPDMVAPSEPSGGQFDGLITYRIDLGAFSGTAEVEEMDENGFWRRVVVEGDGP
jgi:hypothetical protein